MAIRTVTIDAVMNGFVAKVGCQTLVFVSVDDLTMALADYLRHPAEVEKMWVEQGINARHTYGRVDGRAVPLVQPDGSTRHVTLGSAIGDDTDPAPPVEEVGNTTGGANPWADTAQHTRDHMAMATGLPLAQFQPVATGGRENERRYEELIAQRADLLNDLALNEQNLNDAQRLTRHG